MTATTAPQKKSSQESRLSLIVRTLLTQRVALLAVLVVLLVVYFMVLGANDYLTAPYDFDYMASALINAVPMAMLGFAQLFVITSGRGGIDLSVGAIVSLSGMTFGFMYGMWGWSLPMALIATVIVGAILGLLNGILVAYIEFPALIATLATFYAYKSIAVVINDQRPISTKPIQELYKSTASSVPLPLIGDYLPDFPRGVFLFLIPTLIVVWLLLSRTSYGRRVYAIGTNDVAARWSAIDVKASRAGAYMLSGAISGLVAVVTVGQFASARPDAGVSGNGMALPAITIAVLGGVAITGGIGRVSGIVLATLLVVWTNAGIRLAFEGNAGPQFQLLALGLLLIFSALLNGFSNRRYGGAG
ncbi:MAG: ABC transporter permease [Arachnia sp.]